MTPRKKDDIHDYLVELHEYSIDYNNRTIFYYRNNNDEDDVDINSSMMFLKNLHALEQKSQEPITIFLSSYGGNIDSAFAIYDRIIKSPCRITIIANGYCLSAATLILQAADEKVSTKHCSFMLHQGYDSIDLSHKQTRVWVRHLEEIRSKMLDIYAKNMLKSQYFNSYTLNKVKTFIRNKFNTKDDWIMFPEEALTYGLIDKII